MIILSSLFFFYCCGTMAFRCLFLAALSWGLMNSGHKSYNEQINQEREKLPKKMMNRVACYYEQQNYKNGIVFEFTVFSSKSIFPNFFPKAVECFHRQETCK